MEAIWDFAERRQLLAKFELFLRLASKHPLNRGGAAYQAVDALVSLRNALTHFQPEWDDEQVRHAKVTAALRGKFAPSPWFPDADQLFPRGWATVGCTAWAIEACRVFSAEFAAAAEMEDRFARFGSRLVSA